MSKKWNIDISILDKNGGVGVYDVVVGNEKFLVECGITVDKEIKDVANTHEEKGRTVTLIGINGTCCESMSKT